MAVLLSDVELQTQDWLANYSVTSLPLPNIDRAINRAIEFVQRRLTLPSDKQIQSFYYYEDTPYYNCTAGFNELLGLKYNTGANATFINNSNPNTPRQRWNVFKDVEILQNSGSYPNENQVSFTTLNGQNQILMNGRNLNGSYTVNPFNNTNGLTGTSDVSGLAQDTNVYKTGGASVIFNIANGLSATSLSFTGSWNITSLLNLTAAYRMYIDFPTGTTGYFSNVQITLQSSVGNTYSMTTTTQDDGTAWNSGSWSRVSWQLNNATITGTPNPAQITTILITLNHSGGFAPVTGIRFNNLYQITPDYMDAIYLSQYKGTDTTGATQKVLLNTSSDICAFGAYAPDLIGPISMKAAAYLSPSLLADPNFRTIYKEDFEESIRNIGRVYPRQRATGNFGQTDLRRSI